MVPSHLYWVPLLDGLSMITAEHVYVSSPRLIAIVAFKGWLCGRGEGCALVYPC